MSDLRQQKMKKRMDNKRDEKPGRAKGKGTGVEGAKRPHSGKANTGVTNRQNATR